MSPAVLALAVMMQQQSQMEPAVRENPFGGFTSTDVVVVNGAMMQQPERAVAEENLGDGRSAQNNPLANEMTAQLDRTVTRGLAQLASRQNPDGSWGEVQFGRSVAVTSLACLALMADGNTPGRGVYGEQVTKGLEYI
ncbi:MAG: hypothetical protein ACK5P8_00130, partial [Phycisphaerae bacterium]